MSRRIIRRRRIADAGKWVQGGAIALSAVFFASTVVAQQQPGQQQQQQERQQQQTLQQQAEEQRRQQEQQTQQGQQAEQQRQQGQQGQQDQQAELQRQIRERGQQAEQQRQQGQQGQQDQQAELQRQIRERGQQAQQGQQQAQQGQQQAQQQEITDDRIKERIQQLAERHGHEDLEVEVEQGVVKLSGEVQSIPAHRRLIQAIEDTRGVSSVEDELKVAGSDREDQQLQQDVDYALQQQRGGQAKAQVKEGKVTLEGTVSSHQQKQRVEQVVSNIRGIREVENKLEVQTAQQGQQGEQGAEQIWATDRPGQQGQQQAQRGQQQGQQQAQQGQQGQRQTAMAQRGQQQQTSPQQQEEIIRQRFQFDPNLQDADLEVSVEGNTAKLSGTVQSPAHLRMAQQKARITGIQEVDVSEVETRRETSQTSVEQMTQEQIRQRREQGQQATQQRRQVSAEQLESYLTTEFRNDPELSGDEVTVQIEQNQVTLEGTVDTLASKRQAEDIVRRTTGMDQIQNNLEVQFETAAAETGAVAGQTGEQMDDGQIQEQIERALQMDAMIAQPDEIDVEVNEGTVTLSGTANSREQMTRAEQIAMSQPGVVNIQNEIELGGAAEMSDQELVEAIESEFFWSWFVDGGDIDVQAQNGTVTLTGEVDSQYSKESATENAYEAGAREVVNNLQVTGRFDVGAAGQERQVEIEREVELERTR